VNEVKVFTPFLLQQEDVVVYELNEAWLVLLLLCGTTVSGGVFSNLFTPLNGQFIVNYALLLAEVSYLHFV